MSKYKNNPNEDQKHEERILHLRRVSKKTSGGNYISFSALVAIGDGEGNVGIGLGRGLEVPPAIKKAITQAKKHMIHIPIYKDSLPHQVKMKFKASRLLLKPAPLGTGLKVGGVVRAILDIAGVNNASGKIIGTRNQITNAYAVMEALKMLKPRIVAEKKETKVKKEETVKAEPIKEEPKNEVKEEVKVVVDEPKKVEKKATKAPAKKAEPKAKKK